MNSISKSQIGVMLIGFTILILMQSCSETKSEIRKSDSMVSKIDEIVNLYSDYDGFNGAVLVEHEGKLIYKNAFGLANMELDVPNKIDSKFKIASVTKPFTALLILQLVAEGKLDLHTPIINYLPDYPQPQGNKITLHHLLTHSSGIKRDADNIKKFRKIDDIVNQFKNEPLEFEPGTRFSYSNSGYNLLGYIVEKISDKTYEEVLKEKIFKPLGMKSSGFYRHRPIIKNMSSGYFKGFGDYFDINNSDESNAYAAGSIYSTIDDMYLFNQSLTSEVILPRKYLDLIFTKHIADNGYGGHYGYGWEVLEKSIGNSSKMIETVGHSGSIDGYCALYTSIPSTNSTIIFLNNTSRAYLNTMTKAIIGILNNETYDFPKKPLAKFMTSVIHEKGIEQGVLFFKQHKDDPNYQISERELIVAGYKLLQAENVKYAAEVFKLSIEIFPDKYNPYDSYAEALMLLGKKKEAIENYQKSLELNPKNRNAKRMLKKLGVEP